MKHLNQIVLGFVFPFALANAAQGGAFTPTGSMAYSRYHHTGTRLPDGRVLVVAGRDPESGPLASAELYNPATGIWSITSSLINDEDREFHTATLLPNGKVLVAGGVHYGGYIFLAYSSQLYNPTNGAWSISGGGSGRYGHTATLLANGKILFVGGGKVNPIVNALRSVELYDPASNSSSTGNLGTARIYHTATLLPNSKVLVAGGTGDNSSVLTSAELYDPATGTWTPTGSLGTAQANHTATLLPNGKVLVVGGTAAELYNPATGTWSPTGSSGTAHGNTATLLPNGKVLVVGGYNPSDSTHIAEVYDPATGNWMTIGLSPTGYTATLLSNGWVLLAGGQAFGRAELYESFLNSIVNPIMLGNGSFQFSVSNPSGPSCRVVANTDLAAPLNTWSDLGPGTETPPGSGQFQFTDHQAPNYPRRFYRVTSP